MGRRVVRALALVAATFVGVKGLWAQPDDRLPAERVDPTGARSTASQVVPRGPSGRMLDLVKCSAALSP